MGGTLVLGEAITGWGESGDGGGILLLDRDRPPVPPRLPGAAARGLVEYRSGGLSFVRAAEEANRLIQAWAGALDSEGRRLDAIASYDGIPFWEAIEFDLFYGHLAALLDELLLWERVLDVERPDRLVAPPSSAGEVALAVAAARGVPTRTIGAAAQRGASGRWTREAIPPGARAWLRRGRQAVVRWRARWHHRLAPVPPRPGAARRILVLTLVRRFVDVVIPVIRCLEGDRENHVVVVDRNFSTAVPRLRAEGIPYRVFEGYGDRAALGRARREERRFRREWERLRGDPAFRRHFAYHGVDLWPFVRPVLREYFTARFAELVRVVEVTRSLLRAERPHAVVLTDERPPFQRAFTLACRQRGVATVGVQDTLFPDLPYGSPIATDWIAVEGAVARDNLVKGGTPAGKIAVTGQPRFDFVARAGAPYDRGATLGHLGLDPRRPAVLLVSQYAGIYFRADDKRRAFRAIYAALAALPEAQVVVKLHPEDRDGSLERDLAAEAGLRACRVLRGGDASELVHASDLVLVFFSTVGHEAILLDRPLIQIRTGPGEGPIISFTDEGGALDGSRLEELPALVRAALYDDATRGRLRQGREAYVRRHVHALDGRSAERVAALVVRAAGGREA